MRTKGDEVVFPAGDEIEGFWNLDKMHAPRPVSPLSFDLIVRTLAEGFTKAHEDYDCPIMVSTKEINHYLYFAFHPLPDEAEVARRMVHYHDKLAEKVPGGPTVAQPLTDRARAVSTRAQPHVTRPHP